MGFINKKHEPFVTFLTILLSKGTSWYWHRNGQLHPDMWFRILHFHDFYRWSGNNSTSLRSILKKMVIRMGKRNGKRKVGQVNTCLSIQRPAENNINCINIIFNTCICKQEKKKKCVWFNFQIMEDKEDGMGRTKRM